MKKLNIFIPLLILFCFLAFAQTSFAANHYIRAGSTCASSCGGDWTNAYPTFASVTWTRGDTYYLASGTYSETVSINPGVGTSWTYLKKATTDAHGTDTGWDSNYAPGQAVIAGRMVLASAYVDVDGVTGSGNSGHGIKIDSSAVASEIETIHINQNVGNINLSHIEVKGAGSFVPYSSIHQSGIYIVNSSAQSNYNYKYLYIHDYSTDGLVFRMVNGVLIENSYFYEIGATSGDPKHGQPIQLTSGNSANITIRYNTIHNASGSGFLAITCNDSDTYSNVKIYSNLIWTTDRDKYIYSPGFFSTMCTQPVTSGMSAYNNTFYNVRNPNVRMQGLSATGNENRNNIYVNCDHQFPLAGVTSTNNFYYGAVGLNIPSGETNQINGASNPLTNPPADFSLLAGSEPIDAGFDLGSSFNLDIIGTTRPQGATWDIGAYEYQSGYTPPVTPPSDTTPPSAPSGVSIAFANYNNNFAAAILSQIQNLLKSLFNN